jgi:adenylate cyclase
LRIDDQVEVVPKGVKKPITIYEIGGIGGDFNIYLPEKMEVQLFELLEPLPVRFNTISEKHIGKKNHDGQLLF